MEKSAIEVKGLQFSIQSLIWRNNLLEVTFRCEFLPRNGLFPGRGHWGFLHAWCALHQVFFNAAGAQIPPDDFLIGFLHNPDFVREKVNTECVTFVTIVPEGAHFISVEYGSSRYFTKMVLIPPRKGNEREVLPGKGGRQSPKRPGKECHAQMR